MKPISALPAKRLAHFFVLSICALLTPFAFAPYYHFWLMPLLFATLIILAERSPQTAARQAYWFGLLGYAAQFWWIHTALHDISGLPEIYAVPLTLLLPAFLALFPATAFYLAYKNRFSQGTRIAAALPLTWTLAEFLRERALTGFGWGALGYSQIGTPSPLAAFTPVAGIHLTTFATALTGAWLAAALLYQDKRRLLPIIAITILSVSGSLLSRISFTESNGSTASVALLQGNIPQQLKFDLAGAELGYRRYAELLAGTHSQIVVLPETAFTGFLQHTPPELLAHFARLARANGSELAVGIPALTPDGSNYLNAMLNLSAYYQSPETPQLYAKNHLVPFGEYKPLPWLTEPLYRLMNMPLADFQRGGEGQKPFAMAGQQVAFNICYEDGFGDELIASAKQSTLLANASNMAWYGDSNAMWQQLQQSQTRALELGRYMVRATNNGVTAIITPQGQIAAQAVPNTVTALEGKIQGYRGETPYMRLGGSYLLIVLLAAAYVLLLLRCRQPQNAA